MGLAFVFSGAALVAAFRSLMGPSRIPSSSSSPSSSAKAKKKHILLGVCGSVAAIKVPLIVEALQNDFEVQVISTHHALHFFRQEQLRGVTMYLDDDEWTTWSQMGDPVLHIELRRWADIFVIAPLDANTLSKITHGQCDNLLTCVARAWDHGGDKPMLVAPSMNTAMYIHPVTSQQLEILGSWGVTVIPVIAKRLACGDVGAGAMAEWQTIVECTKSQLLQQGLKAIQNE